MYWVSAAKGHLKIGDVVRQKHQLLHRRGTSALAFEIASRAAFREIGYKIFNCVIWKKFFHLWHIQFRGKEFCINTGRNLNNLPFIFYFFHIVKILGA